ncbi:hypothetical protein A8D61_23345 [Burkholderia cenocepacia]|nr:hypothetical protein A8D61_23345 [Burkholderia cenocepacia]KVW13846.1 hypothetical protein WK91_21285 [Burkholderia cepacia]QMI45616.1 hypothetical protein MBR110_09215 [Burkholderia sp. MBR-1]ONJ15664.1 hypothetical protein A8D82_19280 [Burkholderia cenocepacia]ONN76922.1 hypothetical protein A8D63_38160 [Burkholderia cenocepacia]
MPRCHVRCTHCDARRCLRRHPDRYTRLPACRTCNRRKYRVDNWMNRRNTTRMRCDCAGYWFPHRRGSLFCWHRADGSNRYPGDTDFADRNYDGLAA